MFGKGIIVITAIGLCVLDHLFIVDGFSGEEGTYRCDGYHIDGGGMAATALCAAARLGSETRLISRIGDDVNGKQILEGLREFGVDTSYVVRCAGKKSWTVVILVDRNSGEKQFYLDKVQALYHEKIELDISQLRETDVLLLDGHWMESAMKAAEWAASAGIPVVGDFKGIYEGLKNLLRFVTYPIIPDFFAREFTGQKDAEGALRALKKMCPGIPVLTQGAEGGVYLEDGEVKSYRAFPVEVVDTTGAGDAFHGAFCNFLERGCSIEKCLEGASAVGALNCRALGGRKGLPDSKELAEFLNWRDNINQC